MHRGLAATAVLALMTSTVVSAQSVNYWPAPTAVNAAAPAYNFPMGTPLTLTTRTQVSTKINKPGDRFYLEVAESLAFRGQVIVPAGTVAVGEVVRADRNGHFGKKGKLDIRLLYIETAYGPVRLSGHAYDEGTSGTVTSVVTIALVSGLGFLVHGTSAHIPFGTTVTAYFAEPLRFTMQQPQATSVATVQPDNARPLPASFDPSVFGGSGPQAAKR